MKFIVLVVLSSAIAIEAYPFIDDIFGGIGTVVREGSSAVGSIAGLGVGTGVNVGVKSLEKLSTKVVGAGVATVDLGSKVLTELGKGLGSGLRTGLTFNSVGKEPKNVNPSGAGRRQRPGRKPQDHKAPPKPREHISDEEINYYDEE